MTDPLSIVSAAREAPAVDALRVGSQSLTFAELAAAACQKIDAISPGALAGSPVPLVATATLDTVITLLALLERRVTALLLHPKLTAVERAQCIADGEQHASSIPRDAAAIVYTSGTSGVARGAVLTRVALAASAQASATNLGWHDDDCWLLAMPLARIGGLSIITRCLAARRTVALAPAFDAGQLPQWIAQHRVTLLSLVPTMLTLLLDAHPRWTPPTHLRAVLIGGASASPRLLQRAGARGVPIVITYGCTETCSQIVATPYAARFDAARHGAGRALAGAEVRVTRGRIEARGPMRMTGYLGEPPLAPQAWFDTGDLGAFDEDGNLHVHGRATERIVTGGENVDPVEVERVLETCPGVDAAGVFGLADETWGQVVAAVLVSNNEPPTDAVVAAHLVDRLAPHKRPRRIAWVVQLPLTAAGKLDRGALAALAPALHPLHYQ